MNQSHCFAQSVSVVSAIADISRRQSDFRHGPVNQERATLKILAAGILAVLGIAVLGLELIGALDPTAAQMADDNDPFGSPDPWWVHLLRGGSIAVVCFLACWRLSKTSRKA